MKTPMKDRDAVRNVHLVISVSKNEKDMIQAKAEESGLTMSSYVRLKALQSIKEDG